jgi:hypothetical protein
MESEFALVGLEWSHFLRRTGSHFAGKCSKTENPRCKLWALPECAAAI